LSLLSFNSCDHDYFKKAVGYCRIEAAVAFLMLIGSGNQRFFACA
jgi:hypothetical protein